MKNLHKYLLSAAMGVAIMSMAVSCGPSAAEKTERMTAEAAVVDSLVQTTDRPFVVCRAAYAEPNIEVTIVLSDSIIKTDMLGDALMDYYAAAQIKSYDAATVKSVATALKDNDANLVVAVTDAYGNTRNYIFSGDKISRLAKAKRSQLDVPKVREEVIAMAGAAVPAPWAHRGTQVSTSIDKGFLTYTITWPDKSAIAKMPQGVLTGRYMQPIIDQYAALGTLRYPVIEMLKTLEIDGVRIVYAATGTDDEVKQAFPWREIFK